MSNTGVLYGIFGRRYWERIVVSIFSLRHSGYTGPIHIIALDARGAEICGWLAADAARIGPLTVQDYALSPILMNQRGGGYAAKTLMVPGCPFLRGVFLDADTVVEGPFMSAATPQGDEQVVFTQFSNWTAGTRKIAGRIQKWAEKAPALVKAASDLRYPAINTGVYGFRRDAEFFQRRWPQVTSMNVGFICDEIAAQLILPELPLRERRVLDDRYNHSPVYGVAKDDIRIRHFHGDKHLRPGRAADTWLPHYRRAIADNIAGLRDWTQEKMPC